MGDDYGFAFAAIIPFFIVLVSVAVFVKRDNPFIKCRNPTFLIFQNLGTIVPFILFCLYTGMRPNITCEVSFLGYIFTFSLVVVVILIRCWEYCINYHISQLKARFRSVLFEVERVKQSWIYKHRWIAEKRFLRTALVVGVLLFSTPLLQLSTGLKWSYDSSATCVFDTRYQWVTAIFVVVLFSFAVAVATLIYHSSDAYHIKREMIAFAAVWIVAVIATYTFIYVPARTREHAPPVIFLLMGDFATVVISSVVPLLYARRYEKTVSQVREGSDEDFATKLESVTFRNTFHEFLTKQFAQENLQFYEVVKDWKAISPKDPAWSGKAKAIYDNFIIEGSVCQVYVEDDVQREIIAQIEKGEFPDSVFDDALHPLIHDMYVNSYKLFMTTPAYKNMVLV